MSTEYLSVKSFSERSGLSVQMVRKQIYNGRLKAYRQNVGLANYLIPADELHSFVTRQPARRTKRPDVTTGSNSNV